MIVSLLFRYECYDWDIYENFKMFSLYMCLTYMYISLIKYRTITMLVFIPEFVITFLITLLMSIQYISEYSASLYTWNCPPYRKLDENLALGCDCYLYETLLVVQTTISGGQCGTPASVQGVLFGYVNKTSPMYFENQKLTNFLCCEWFYYYQYM